MIRLVLLGIGVLPTSAWAQHVTITPRTMAFEDVDAPGSSDDDWNDVVFRLDGQCDVDGQGRIVRAWLGFAPQAMGAARVNSLWITPAAPATVTLHVGGLPPAGASASLGGGAEIELLPDFRDGFAGATSGFVNTAPSGSRIDGISHVVEIVFAAPYVGPCDGTVAPFSIRNSGLSAPIDVDTRVGPNLRPLAGVFPGEWRPPHETVDVAEAYPRFLPWVADIANAPCETECTGAMWHTQPDTAQVDPRLPDALVADAPLLAFPACDDGVQNGGETEIDCGDPLGICGPCGPVPQPDDLVVFVTSGTVVVGALGGGGSSYDMLDAADDHCEGAAASAGLGGKFVAWLSQGSTEHAQSRLPIGAGPWVRRDGLLVGNNRADFTDGAIANPISLDESGASYNGYVATATNGFGNGTGLHDCAGGTDTGLMVTVGWSTDAATDDWTEKAFGYCSASYPIYCFEVPAPKRIFVTTSTYQGNFGGIAFADAACAQHAAAASLPGTYLAWLSDGTTSPDARLRQWGYAYVNGAGVALASDWADLTDGTVGVEMNYRADGVLDVGTARTWTGTGADGLPLGPNCSGWTSLSGTGQAGLDTFLTAGWTEWSAWSCSSASHLYCVEQ